MKLKLISAKLKGENMNRKYFLLMLLFIIISLTSKADYDLHYFTDYKIGDKITTNENDKALLNYVIFINPHDCFTCLESINNLFENVSKHIENFKFTVFIPYSNSVDATEIKKSNDWPFEVISDPFGVYKEFFKVKITPIYFIYDQNGKILFIDKCGGIYTDIEKITQKINEINFEYQDRQKNLTKSLIKEIDIKKDGSTYPTTYRTHIDFDNKSGTFYSLNRTSKTIDFVDTQGIVFKIIDLKKIKGLNLVQSISLQRIVGDSIFFYTDINFEAVPVSYLININSNTLLKTINYQNPYNKGKNDKFRILHNVFLDYTHKKIYISSQPISNDYKGQFKPILVFDIEGKFLKSIGIVDSIFIKHKLFDIFNIDFYRISDSLTLAIESNTTKIMILNDEKIQDSFSFQLKEPFKLIDHDIPNMLTINDWFDINESKSYISTVYFDNKNYYIVFYNVKYNKKEGNPTDDNNINFFFIL